MTARRSIGRPGRPCRPRKATRIIRPSRGKDGDAQGRTDWKVELLNPYRKAFYERQYEWHGYRGAEDVRQRHSLRSRYYAWYTRGWLPAVPATPVLDIGCGSGQFLYFLREQGFTDTTGLDLDVAQVDVARALGLSAHCADVQDFLRSDANRYGLVAMLDILEHFTRAELFPLLTAVADRLLPGGRVIASVPNAESPDANRAIYADITHEIAFTPTSLTELFFCHGLRVTGFRDPWPAPVSPVNRVYRALALATRGLESLRLRMLGFDAPRCWSSVIWVMAEKPREAA
jgi:2-polyprenyl-3-methyl-5-hydroxy-6-metoxy-1,4-benzoquinol methylase